MNLRTLIGNDLVTSAILLDLCLESEHFCSQSENGMVNETFTFEDTKKKC